MSLRAQWFWRTLTDRLYFNEWGVVEGYYGGVYLCKYEVLGAICFVGLINSGLFGQAVVKDGGSEVNGYG